MARPVGSTSHWWKTRKIVSVYLYNPTDEKIQAIRDLTKQLNDKSYSEAMGE